MSEQPKVIAFSLGAVKKKNVFEMKKKEEEQRKKRNEEEAMAATVEAIGYFDAPAAKGFVKGGEQDPPSKSASAPLLASAPTDTRKHDAKKSDKKPSNLEAFKEQLKRAQEQREEKHQSKKAEVFAKTGNSELASLVAPGFDEPTKAVGSFDNGDPNTTNLFVGNLSPEVTEELVCEAFARHGPLASVKIMWPRNEEEQRRPTRTGFVAFMTRADAEHAYEEMAGELLLGFDLRLSWGKAVAIPPVPVYTHSGMGGGTGGARLDTGLPFNAFLERRRPQYPGHVLPPYDDEDVMDAVVMVTIPRDKGTRQLIHRTIEFVIREGPTFEKALMDRASSDPKYAFLFDHRSEEHVYYRWKLYSLLQGEDVHSWSVKPFCMHRGGSMWQPPAVPKQLQRVEKGRLSSKDRSRLEDLLREMTMERTAISDVMYFCMSRAEAAEEIVECIEEALGMLSTPVSLKVARIFLVSDILYNSGALIPNAANFRRSFEGRLLGIFKNLNATYRAIQGRLRADHFKNNVMACIAAWKQWSLFTPFFFQSLEDAFLAKPKDAQAAPLPPADTTEGKGSAPKGKFLPVGTAAPVVAAPASASAALGVGGTEDEDLDGVPLNMAPPAAAAEYDEDLDGVPLTEEDLDGVPLDAPPSKMPRMV